MPKFLLAADIHLHCHKKSNDRLNDCLRVLDWIFRTAKDQKVTNILFLGDLFHDRQAVPIPTYQKTFEIFRRHLENSNIHVYLLLGNHDLWHLSKWDISSVFPLEAVNNVHVVDKPCTIDIDGFPISFLPYTADPLKDLSRIQNKHDIRVLCGHIAIDGAVLNTMHNTRSEVGIEYDGGMAKMSSDALGNWQHVFLGHYHAAQQLGHNVEYVGSPLQLSFGEAFQHKHVLVFDTDTNEKNYIRNTFSPQHFIIPKSDLEKYNLEGNFIKVVVDDISASDIVDIRNDLVDNHNVGSFEVIQEVKTHEQKQVVEDAKAILLNQGKMVEEYIKQLKASGSLVELKDDVLQEVWNKIIEKTESK